MALEPNTVEISLIVGEAGRLVDVTWPGSGVNVEVQGAPRSALLNLTDLADVTSGNAADGDVIVQQAGVWVNEPQAAGGGNVPTELSLGTVGTDTVGITSDGGADDVILPAATTSAAGMFTADQADRLEVAEVWLSLHANGTGDDHSYIDQPVTAGSAPNLDATNFTNLPAGGANALDDLTDVTISAPTEGQMIQLQSGIWVNVDAPSGGGGADNYSSDSATPFNQVAGFEALNSITTGTKNTATGYHALRNNTEGEGNIAVGYYALINNTTGQYNAAFGTDALASNTIGGNNLAIGGRALNVNVSGSNNTGVGYWGGRGNTGSDNVLIGYRSGYGSNAGGYNVGVGSWALYGNQGLGNTGLGGQASYSITTGINNVGIGRAVGYKPRQASGNGSTTANSQTLVGSYSGQLSPTQSDQVTALGYYAGVDAANAMALGAKTTASAAGAVAIGTSAAGVGASATTADEIALGTAAHDVVVPGTLTTTHGDEAMKAELAASTDFADFQSRMAAL